MDAINIHAVFAQDVNLDIQKAFSSSNSVCSSEDECTHKEDFGEGITCSAEPFSHCVVLNFLSDQQLIDDLQKTLLTLEYMPKSNDLYKFTQTGALENREESAIKSMRSALYKVRDWLSLLLDVKLYDKIDMFSAQYNYTDTLLCHDDKLEGRRVAYIYYLVPDDWSTEDGGTLDLYSIDTTTGLPVSIVKSVTPVRNSFLFFEVTHKSYHQVAEVLSRSKCRLSISGWFHGPPAIRPSFPSDTQANIAVQNNPVNIEEEHFYKHINSEYTNPATLAEIQETFEEESEIQLQDFLCGAVYELMSKDISSSEIVWRRVGPAIKRNVEMAEVDTLPSSIRDCIQFLMSDALFLTLSNITGLKLHPLAASSDDEEEPQSKKSKASNGQSTSAETSSTPDGDTPATCGTVSYQVRRWSHGTYTMLHDTDMEQGKDCALDAVIHFNCHPWEERQGGYTSYVAKGEDEELITVEPRENCLSLVYRDREALRFVKHVNHRITETDHPYLYDISLVYHECS